jgi:uncharacterized protein (TIGR04255 family)
MFRRFSPGGGRRVRSLVTHMRESKMTDRPADLPDFTAPPVTEVILGVQFNNIAGFLTPHLGLVWERFKARFPKVEEYPPIPPTYETFGSHAQFAPNITVQFTPVELPRVFFINESNTELLQVQRDRFLHNWRKVGAGDKYPRFERMIETFELGLTSFIDVITTEKLGAFTPNQCEVTYINQIPVAEDREGLTELIERVFPNQLANTTLDGLGRPEDFRFLVRYVIRHKDSPIGRLLVSADPARRADGVTILQLTLTARGKPFTPDISGAIDFLECGRLHVVRSFAKLTSSSMHEMWGRKQ